MKDLSNEEEVDKNNNHIQDSNNDNNKDCQDISSDINTLEYEAISKLEKQAEKLKEENELFGLLFVYEKLLVLRRHLFGSSNPAVKNLSLILSSLYLHLSLSSLSHDQLSLTLELLTKADEFGGYNQQIKAAVHNNLACYYKKQGDLVAALQYAKSAIKLEERSNKGMAKRADSELNLCAILSQLKRHDEASLSAKKSLSLLVFELFGRSGNSKSSNLLSIDYIRFLLDNHSSIPSNSTSSTLSLDRISVLCIAYHNLAVESEYLHDWDTVGKCYACVLLIIDKKIDEKNPLAITIRKSFEEAKKNAKSNRGSSNFKSTLNHKHITTTSLSTSTSTPVIIINQTETDRIAFKETPPTKSNPPDSLPPTNSNGPHHGIIHSKPIKGTNTILPSIQKRYAADILKSIQLSAVTSVNSSSSNIISSSSLTDMDVNSISPS